MGVQAKGEFEQTYFGGPENPAPCGGVNYSSPYTAIPPTDLAPGTVNTQNINGFLCASPWVGSSPFVPPSPFAAGEYVLGTFEITGPGGFAGSGAGASNLRNSIIVTNVKVYLSTTAPTQASQLTQVSLSGVHTWSGGEVNTAYMFPGQAVSFVQSGDVVYFTGLMLVGIFAVGIVSGGDFIQATDYVAGRYIAELAGRLVVAECLFPGGGGTGTNPLPTIAWSGVGIFGQAWDGNPSHDVWNAANQAFFNGNIGGFNLLGDVPDQITGMGTVGQSIIIVRQNGLTQQDPNSTYSNSGIQPYNWYHMWSSAQGVGGVAGTVAQWGQALTFRSSDNVYTLSMSSGLVPMGTKIIAKIIADQIAIENSPGVFLAGNGGGGERSFWNSWWNFASIYNLDGQLHYLLTFSAYTTNTGATLSAQNTLCYAYDINMGDGSAHFWDFGKYYQQGSAGVGFLGISCPLVTHTPSVLPFTGGAQPLSSVSNPRFFVLCAYTSYGTITTPSFTGLPFILVPYDYDFISNPITNYVALLYVPLSLPSMTVVFRGETLALGHKITTRRLRLQADNAPAPTIISNAQQQAQTTITGATSGAAKSPIINMQGNLAPTGLAIRTYYGDAVLSDEMIQPSLTSVFSATTPWQTLCAFRIASASLIGIDATGTTQ